MAIENILLLAIPVIAVIVAIFRLIYKIRSDRQSRNRQKFLELLPQRREVYNLSRSYLEYCSRWITLIHLGEVKNGTELLSKREEFINQLDTYGPLNMPIIEQLTENILSESINLQRVTDRWLNAGRPENSQLKTELENSVDWLTEQYRILPDIFLQYLELN